MPTHKFALAEPMRSPQGHDRYVCRDCGLITQLNDKQSLNPDAICYGINRLCEEVVKRMMDESNVIWCQDNPIVLPDWRQVLGGPEYLDDSIFPIRWGQVQVPSDAEEMWLPTKGNPIFWCNSGIVTITSGPERVLVARKGAEQYKYGNEGLLIRIS